MPYYTNIRIRCAWYVRISIGIVSSGLFKTQNFMNKSLIYLIAKHWCSLFLFLSNEIFLLLWENFDNDVRHNCNIKQNTKKTVLTMICVYSQTTNNNFEEVNRLFKLKITCFKFWRLPYTIQIKVCDIQNFRFVPSCNNWCEPW